MGATTCDEAVLAFLRAELDSPTEGDRVRRTVADLGVAATVITHPDAGDAEQAELRWSIFQAYRGGERLFEGLPLRDLAWHRAALSECSLRERVRTCRHGYESRFGTRKPAEVAAAIDQRTPDEPNGVMARVRSGDVLEPPLLVAATPQANRLVILEGHNRLIAYLRDPEGVAFPIPVFVGIAPWVANWHQW